MEHLAGGILLGKVDYCGHALKFDITAPPLSTPIHDLNLAFTTPSLTSYCASYNCKPSPLMLLINILLKQQEK